MLRFSYIQLSDHFTYRRLIRFTWPSMMMMIVTAVYGVVDGVMVSNFAGTTSFAAINLIWPFIAVLGAVGFMIGTGGSALVAKTLGMQNVEHARDLFSMLTYVVLILSVVMSVAGLIVVKDVSIMLGAEGELVELCTLYGRILLLTLPAYILQVYFQSLLITAERPKMGMWVTIGAGLMNVVLDLLFIGVWGWGVAGAAWATGLSQLIGGGIPLAFFFFSRKRNLKLRLGRCHLDLKALWQACSNGISEFVMQISLSIVSMLYMYQLLHEAGENGVAAYGIMMYFAFTFSAIFLGYGIGSAPVVSYHFGAGNTDELSSLLRKSLRVTTVVGVAIVVVAQLFARPLSSIFVGYDQTLLDLTVHAFRLYSLMFLVTGFNVFASAFFTALNNGPVSALISVLRTLVFEAGCVLLLPLLFGIEGIWWSVTVAETITMLISFYLLYRYRNVYGYN